MKPIATALGGVMLLELDTYLDDRGSLVELFRRDRYSAVGIADEFVQDNLSISSLDVVRGIHYQLEHPQGKLVYAVEGAVYDVAVDIRRGSPTFGTWFGAELSGANHRQLWIPPGYGHAFVAMTKQAIVSYKLTSPYAPGDEHSIAWNDPELAITWPITGKPKLSTRDRTAPPLRTATLPEYRG